MPADSATDEIPEDVVIDAAFFDNILETDIANIIKKATNGTPLSKREREMVEQERTRLQQKPSVPAFSLEGEGATSRLSGLTQSQLADAWGYSTRSIKGWLAIGREKGDPCPLHRPDDMLAWFSRVHIGREVPDKLRDASKRLLEAQAGPASPSPEVHRPIFERIEIPDEQKGLLAMLNRYRDAEPALHAKYMAAIEAGDEAKAGFYMREWSTMGEKLRALEKIAPKALEELGIYVRKDDVVRELETLHRSIIKSIRQALRMSRPRLRASETGEEWNATTDAIVDELCAMLVESDFAEPLLLEVA